MSVQHSSHSIRRRILCVFRSQCSWESVPALESIENLVWSRFLRFFLMDLACFLQLDGFEVCIEGSIHCREGSFLNSDANYVMNSLFVSVMCGLMESLTIPNYDNYTIFLMGILAFHFVHSTVCETNDWERGNADFVGFSMRKPHAEENTHSNSFLFTFHSSPSPKMLRNALGKRE